jgi:hypothetical protein
MGNSVYPLSALMCPSLGHFGLCTAIPICHRMVE